MPGGGGLGVVQCVVVSAAGHKKNRQALYGAARPGFRTRRYARPQATHVLPEFLQQFPAAATPDTAECHAMESARDQTGATSCPGGQMTDGRWGEGEHKVPMVPYLSLKIRPLRIQDSGGTQEVPLLRGKLLKAASGYSTPNHLITSVSTLLSAPAVPCIHVPVHTSAKKDAMRWQTRGLVTSSQWLRPTERILRTSPPMVCMG
ncbi:hypothetical protein BDP55DRAFT_627607 [Colletotrichum godetiae]|uniref:Uncharacterized protein n=1 Tax=Colletotrichum godetiae TaxID=1209918 RepID=A0AAJ0AV29_9PEZI|nr:uncharacterized protein BDP55DRAFT_627607 [Colletotrichum godetiae]KAK1690921.1 hypothetical protein BDP55DRAFT_627607 [Colletotrichum godetiae]